MKLRQKIILLAIAPLFFALCAIALAVRHQAVLLAGQQRISVEEAYFASKQAELKHYVALGTRSIAHLYDSGRNDNATLHEAKSILAKLDYGDDGYFFIYDLHGTTLMHPRQPDLVGRNLWDMTDARGNYTIRNLISRAQAGGGFERYMWEKPSVHHIAPKLGYVVMLERWGWMLGTGIYLDDVEAALAEIDVRSSGNIRKTMLWIAGIAIASALTIALSGLALNVSENRLADAKLRVLAQRVVRSQEEERARLSRDLHDGISQWLVSIKLQLEAGIARLSTSSVRPDSARVSLDRAASQLNDVLGEVRRISPDLRPAILDDLGLAAALDHLVQEFARNTSIAASFEDSSDAETLDDAGNTVLFRIAQEALTNIKRHAGATEVKVSLAVDAKRVTLCVIDNGVGFDVAKVASHPKRGIGLRNMHERLEPSGGQLQLESSGTGTRLTASLNKA